MNPEDELSEKDKLISIHLDDFEPDPNKPEPDENDHGGEEPGYLLGMELTPIYGSPRKFIKNLEDQSDDEYLLLHPEDEEVFHQMLAWSSILSLAGARTFTDPVDMAIFASPTENWVDLYFSQLPESLADATYAELVWIYYQSIDVWLSNEETGTTLASLRLVPPADHED